MLLACYQLDFVTPGTLPSWVSSRRAIRDMPNFRRYPRGLPVTLHRFRCRTGLEFRGSFANARLAAKRSSIGRPMSTTFAFNAARLARNLTSSRICFFIFSILLVLANCIHLFLQHHTDAMTWSQFAKGMPNFCSNALLSSTEPELEITNVIFIPRTRTTLSKSTSGKIVCSRMPNV